MSKLTSLVALACIYLMQYSQKNINEISNIFMKKLDSFILNNALNNLTCVFDSNTDIIMSYEYLRVFSPTEIKKIQSNKTQSTTPQVFHKKNVKLIAIEPLAKHGYRFLFDDNYNDIFSDTDLMTLSQNHLSSWPAYKATLTTTNNREESINFKAVT